MNEWLWAVCENLELDLLVAELEGRHRAVWMKTGYLADVGERPDLGAACRGGTVGGGGGPLCSGGGNAACRIRPGTVRCAYPNTNSSTICSPLGGARSWVSNRSIRPRCGSATGQPALRYQEGIPGRHPERVGCRGSGSAGRRRSIHVLYGLHEWGVYEATDLTLKGGTALRKYHLGHRSRHRGAGR